MGEVKDLSYLGIDFQYRLILQIISDEKFARIITPIIKPEYFQDENLKLIIATIKDAFDKSDIIIDIIGIETRILSKITDEIKRTIFAKSLIKIRDSGLNDSDYIQEMGIKFCKLKELSKAVDKIKKIINKGEIENLDECETIIKKAIEIGENNDEEAIDAFKNDDIDELLSEDFRDPIPTGIDKLDEYMNGGLSKQEFAIVIAPTGVGKAQPLDSKILTPKGYVEMGDLKIGDELISSDGSTSTIEGVYPQKGLREVVKLVFNDTTSFNCDLEHLTTVLIDGEFKTLTTKNIIEEFKLGKTITLPNNPIDIMYNEELKVYLPYMVGAMSNMLLGYSNFENEDFVFIPHNKEIIKEFRKVLSFNESEISDDAITNLIINSVKKNDEIINDRIPKAYLFSKLDKRKELVRGIINTNGIIDNENNLELFCFGEKKVDDIITLFKSLAFNIERVENVLENTYTIKISKSNRTPEINVKINNWDKINTIDKDINLVNYQYLGEKPVQCIKVSAKDSLYITDGFNLTHNTTLLTKIANTAKKNGNNVLQLFFEDTLKVIRRKHLACSSGIEINEMHNHKDFIKTVNEEMMNSGGILKLHKFKGNTTINTIRNYIKRLRSKGFKPDVIILDYLDCVQPSIRSNDSNNDEGIIAREFENLLEEFDCAGWAATQSNRSGVSSDIVTADKVGGSFKKIQIGHFVMSIAKTLEQREQDKANMAILKSRIGQDGIVMNDVIFNNKKIEIIINEKDEGNTFFENNKLKEAKRQEHVSEVMDQIMNMKKENKKEEK